MTCGRTGLIAAWCPKGGNNHLFAIDEDDSENHAETLVLESENERWTRTTVCTQWICNNGAECFVGNADGVFRAR